MQDRYAADVGDYIKLGLLRALSRGRRLGVAWYLFPDEGHNEDGKFSAYLDRPSEWRALDPELFEKLYEVRNSNRSVAGIQNSKCLDATFFDTRVPDGSHPAGLRCEARTRWFGEAQNALRDCDMVFADPDNGLTDDQPKRRRSRTFGKQLPLSEARALADGRSAVIYHHNTRFCGGHDREVDRWLGEFGNALAVRATAYNCRTFFVINPDADLMERTRQFCDKWSGRRVWLHKSGKTN